MTAHEPPQWVNIVDPDQETLTSYWSSMPIVVQAPTEWDELFERLDHIERLILNNTERLRELVEILKERA